MKFLLSSLAIASLSITSTQVFAQENVITSSPKTEDVKGFYGTLGLGYAGFLAELLDPNSRKNSY